MLNKSDHSGDTHCPLRDTDRLTRLNNLKIKLPFMEVGLLVLGGNIDGNLDELRECLPDLEILMLKKQLAKQVFVLCKAFDEPHTSVRVALIKRFKKLRPLHEAIDVFELQRDVKAHGGCEFDRIQRKVLAQQVTQFSRSGHDA